MKITLLGAPGAGKGTQAEILSQTLAVPAISTGNMLRTAIAEKTTLGLRVEDILKRGDLVDDDTIFGILQERIAMPDCSGGYILDGVPRTDGQAHLMEVRGIEVQTCLFFDIADAEVVNRLSGRRSCACGAAFHVTANPPKVKGVCDKCGATLTIREDDKPETIQNRLKVFREQTASLVEFYQSRGKLVTIDGGGTVEETTAHALKALDAN